MVDLDPRLKSDFGGGGGELPELQKFVLSNQDIIFAPRYYPERVRVRKQRELDRSSGFCKGEDVTDQGSKNREFHITGPLRHNETRVFDAVIDSGDPFDMITDAGTYEVLVSEGEYDGPQGVDGPSRQLLWTYTIDLVSTGRDEPEPSGNGVISGPDGDG